MLVQIYKLHFHEYGTLTLLRLVNGNSSSCESTDFRRSRKLRRIALKTLPNGTQDQVKYRIARSPLVNQRISLNKRNESIDSLDLLENNCPTERIHLRHGKLQHFKPSSRWSSHVRRFCNADASSRLVQPASQLVRTSLWLFAHVSDSCLVPPRSTDQAQTNFNRHGFDAFRNLGEN